MRMKLYALEIERADGDPVSGYIVAPTEKQAAIMVIDHDLANEKTHESFTLERIDRKVTQDHRKGLEDVLSAGLTGFARYVEPDGWLFHFVVDAPLKLFKVLTREGLETHVVAANENEAVAIYMGSYTLADGEHRLFKIVDGVSDLPPERRAGLDSILEFGPRGVAQFHEESGWSVRPPG